MLEEHTCIDRWLVNQRVGGCFHESRHEAQFDVVLLEESVFVGLPHLCDVAAVRDKEGT